MANTNSVNEVSQSLNGAGKHLAKNAKTSFAGFEKKVGELTHDIGEQAGEMVSKLSHSASDMYSSGSTYVKKNPAKGVAIAAAAGILLGGILTACMRRK